MIALGIALRLLACIAAGGAAFMAFCGVSARLQRVGLRSRKLTLEQVVADPLLCFAVLAAAAVVLCWVVAPPMMPIGVLVAFVLSRRAPAVLERRRCQRVRHDCEAELDVLADIVALCMGAGLSFDAALELYCSEFQSELAQQLRRTQQQWTNGLVTRESALHQLADELQSPLLKRFVGMCTHAVGCGAPLSGMLVSYAHEVRAERSAAVERQVQKAPVKMLVPTGVCILPAMLILVMAPMLLQFAETGF